MSAVPEAEGPVLIREDHDAICTLTMNRPKQMNLLTSEMIAAIQDALDNVAQDDGVRVVVLAANGKGFCAGHDLKEIRALGDKHKVEALFRRCARMMLSIQQLPQPVRTGEHSQSAFAMGLVYDWSEARGDRVMRERIEPIMLAKARALVNRHLERGDLCAVITATNSFITGPIAAAFGIQHLIATVPEIREGR